MVPKTPINSLKILIVLPLSFFCISLVYCQYNPEDKKVDSRIYSKSQLEELMKRPACLEGYQSNQSGPLSRIDAKDGEKSDSTFTVEKIKIPSDGLMITGWLYLPLGEGKFPLIVLTNGGGDGTRQIKSLSDWIAPILAHCGYAAFVHDKRGTGESEGVFVASTYEDFIQDAGNCTKWLSKHPRINSDKIGIMGGSEGGLIAVSAACRYPEIKFVISYAGTVVTGIEDRLNAQLNGMIDSGVLNDTLLPVIKPLWEKSFRAWASHDPAEHQKVDLMIDQWREHYNRQLLPYKNREMDSIPAFSLILPTWNSIGFDYLTELESFTKPWLSIFGEVDRVVPTQASVRNIGKFMGKSGNTKYSIAVIPRCGHAPVDTETHRLVRIDNLLLNWLNQNVSPLKCVQQCAVTYIANEGFLIETANHKILVDALFGNIQGNWCDQPGDSITNLMLKGLPPFDNIDVVLVTHKHSDHFNEAMVASFLSNNRKSILVCPDQVNDLLRKNTAYSKISDRIHSLKSDPIFDNLLVINGINLGIMRFNHGSWFETDSITGEKVDLHSGVENFGYLIKTDGFTLFHSGDGSPANKDLYKRYGFGNKELDVAFMDRVFLRREGQDLLNEYIHTRNLIFMHIEPGKAEYYQSVIKSVPEMFVFTRPMEKKVFIHHYNQSFATSDKDKRAIEEYLKRIPSTKDFLAKNHRRNKLDRPGLCLNLIGVKPGMKIGEAGAGAGYFTFFLSKKVGKSGVIYANDNDKFVLAALEHYATESRQLKNIVTVLGNDTDPLFPVLDLDMIVVYGSFHDFTERKIWLDNAFRYLKPGGTLAIIDGYYPEHGALTKELVEDLCRQAGFRNVLHKDLSIIKKDRSQHVQVFLKSPRESK